ncbi:hypothetical protein BDM02DRAFT_3113346 [Thelephora ganbajun]|uniref:Uncharacterized protein n=1 Tax=Thelephora ganbajun TaxID=370292 RepID=A0ACB6ZJX2_THEGA|nr:hypothetical protein BDM02DRAFT_3113346 [Thelephora ganbajun]
MAAFQVVKVSSKAVPTAEKRDFCYSDPYKNRLYAVKRQRKVDIRYRQFHREVHILARFKGSSWLLSLISAFYGIRK